MKALLGPCSHALVPRRLYIIVLHHKSSNTSTCFFKMKESIP
jgi:hypothetical protein